MSRRASARKPGHTPGRLDTPMEEIEKRFKCPYCLAGISMLLDLSEDTTQTYIEDCEVCCRPIQITFTASEGELTAFSRQAIA